MNGRDIDDDPDDFHMLTMLVMALVEGADEGANEDTNTNEATCKETLSRPS